MVDDRDDGWHATALWQFAWDWIPGRDAAEDRDLLSSCTELYSAEYGRWGPRGNRPGEAVRFSPSQLADLLSAEDSWLACAYSSNTLAGYCTAVRFDLPGRGRVAWVTQLVVSQAFRRAGVATNLLFGVWQFTDCYAWGLATANPFAVRALETATRRPCRTSEIRKRAPELLQNLSLRVQYVPDQLVIGPAGRAEPRINTHFFLDHSELSKMREAARRPDRPWGLGALSEGEEWFACTFGAQMPEGFDEDRLGRLLEGSDEIWVSAYEGMTLDSEHRWRAHTSSEVDYALTVTGISTPARVLDIGCGDGRHAIMLAERGFDVSALDISESLVRRGIERAGSLPIAWSVRDVRAGVPSGPFDLVLCLYDVIGSSASPLDDVRLLTNVASALDPGGYLILSVMNTEATLPRLPVENRPHSISEFVVALEKLPPSSTMEQSGAIFDPELLLHYEGVYYRKEQFEGYHGRLPTELVVRDKRYSTDELAALLDNARFDALDVRPVRLGHWSDARLPGSDDRAKELVAVARRR
jgi:2-polyprenyl-3-methyl-5-hydroxy-6-metoxy-1,4-benzoquinol methylase